MTKIKGCIRDYTNQAFINILSIKRIRPARKSITTDLPEHVTEADIQFQGSDKWEWLKVSKEDTLEFMKGDN